MKKNKNNYYTRMLKICRQHWSMNNEERKKCFKNAQKEMKECDKKMPKWQCNICHDFFSRSEVQCDHIIAVGDTIAETKEDFIAIFDKLHCSHDFLQILCINCHNLKTKQDIQNKNRIEMQIYIKYLLRKMQLDEINTDDIDYDKIKRLHLILYKIDSLDINSKNKKIWDKKLYNFIENL